MELNEQAVLRTILYADIFNFPLTHLEIWSGLLTDRKIAKNAVDNAINSLLDKKIIISRQGFLGVEKSKIKFVDRTGSAKVLEKKLEIASKAGLILAKIPSVDLVGISGGVAVGDVDPEDDIDFFIISGKNFLWTTRLMCISNLRRYDLLRSRNATQVENKICLNMFISSNYLEILPENRDVYTAHEVAQLLPVYSRADTYQRFIEENLWILQYLPNFKQKKPIYTGAKPSTAEIGLMYSVPMVQLAKYLQKIYMRSHKTSEIVTDEIFAFHPRDYHKFVLTEYLKRLKLFNLKEK